MTITATTEQLAQSVNDLLAQVLQLETENRKLRGDLEMAGRSVVLHQEENDQLRSSLRGATATIQELQQAIKSVSLDAGGPV